MKFKEIKKYISAIDRVSICMYETLRYENYRFIRRVPDKYDEYYVYGIGLIESEFEIEEAKEYFERAAANDPMLQMRVGLEYCYRFNDWNRGKEHLNSSAEKGYRPAQEAMNAISRELDARIVIGALDLFYYAGNIIDEKANYYNSNDASQSVDKKLRDEIRMKREGWGMTMR